MMDWTAGMTLGSTRGLLSGLDVLELGVLLVVLLGVGDLGGDLSAVVDDAVDVEAADAAGGLDAYGK